MDNEITWARIVRAVNGDSTRFDEHGRLELLKQAVELGAGLTGDSAGCSITVATGTGYRTPVASNALAMDLDDAQYVDADGPCVAACRDGQPHSIVIMSDEADWPTFTAAALAHGVRSSLSLPLTGGTPAALNLYAHSTNAFTPDRARATAALLARCAERLQPDSVAQRPLVDEQVRAAYGRREVVQQAQAILAAQVGDRTTALRQMMVWTRTRQQTMAQVASAVIAERRGTHE